MIKFGECVVCAVDCCWIISDGELYEEEVCCDVHLDYLKLFGALLAQQSIQQINQDGLSNFTQVEDLEE